MSIFMILASSPTLEATSFKMGAIALHGPHHSAEKSISTGISEFMRSLNDFFVAISLFYGTNLSVSKDYCCDMNHRFLFSLI